MLTQLEQRILEFIRSYIAQHGQGPTLTEIGAAMEIKSKGTVHRYVQALTSTYRCTVPFDLISMAAPISARVGPCPCWAI